MFPETTEEALDAFTGIDRDTGRAAFDPNDSVPFVVYVEPLFGKDGSALEDEVILVGTLLYYADKKMGGRFPDRETTTTKDMI